MGIPSQQFLSTELPPVPDAVLDKARSEWPNQAPLEILCVPVQTAFWRSFGAKRQLWYDSQVGKELEIPRGIDGFLSGLYYDFPGVLVRLFWHLREASEQVQLSDTLGFPEISVNELDVRRVGLSYFRKRKSFLVGVCVFPEDMLHPEKLQLAMARLFSYMLLNNARAGVVTSVEQTYFCRRSGRNNKVMLVSRPVFRTECPLVSMGFILDEGRRLWKEHQDGVVNIPRALDVPFDMAPLLERFKKGCLDMEVAKVNSMVQGVEVLQHSSLEQVNTLASDALASCMMRAEYKGAKVVVKVRDLTRIWCNWEENLNKTIREVDVYTRLRKCQGKCIPRLISYGFMQGGMLTYIIMSDEKTHDLMVPPFVPAQYNAVASGAVEALKRMHARGILHGALEVDSVVLRERAANNWSAKLVGFSAALVNQKIDSSAMARERVALDDIVNYFQPDSDSEPEG